MPWFSSINIIPWLLNSVSPKCCRFWDFVCFVLISSLLRIIAEYCVRLLCCDCIQLKCSSLSATSSVHARWCFSRCQWTSLVPVYVAVARRRDFPHSCFLQYTCGHISVCCFSVRCSDLLRKREKKNKGQLFLKQLQPWLYLWEDKTERPACPLRSRNPLSSHIEDISRRTCINSPKLTGIFSPLYDQGGFLRKFCINWNTSWL